MNKKVILASASPHRKKILNQIGLDFEVIVSDYEEDMTCEADPYKLVNILSEGKANDVAIKYPDRIVLGADTFVIDNGKFIGKPKSEIEAREMLNSFSGRKHEIITGYTIMLKEQDIIKQGIGKAVVNFRDLSESEIDDYIATGDSFGKAGAYGLSSKAAPLIDTIEGDFYSVIGLPINQVFVELRKMGVKVY